MLLKYSDIRGKKGVWELWNLSKGRCSDETLFASDGKEAWHCNPDGTFCCEQVHTDYLYKPSNVKAQQPDGGQVSRATNDKVLLLCSPSKSS